MVTLELPLTTPVAEAKARALALTHVTGDPDEYQVKFRGAELFDEKQSLGDAALVANATMIVLPRWGWRVVFFVGVLPAFLTFWVRRHVREPELWLNTRGSTRARGRLGDVFRDGRAGVTAAVTAMNACTLQT